MGAVIAGVLVSGLLGAPPALAAGDTAGPPIRPDKSTPGKMVPAKPAPPTEIDKHVLKSTPKVAWPAAGSAEVALQPGGAGASRRSASEPAQAPPLVRAGKLPVWVGGVDNEAGSLQANADDQLRRVRVTLIDPPVLGQTPRDRLLMRVTRADGIAADARVAVELDYSEFQYAFGSDWNSRLRLVALPECGLTTPNSPACQGQSVGSSNSHPTRRVSAKVSVPPAAAAVGPNAASESGQLFALEAGQSGVAGDYKATSLSPSATWSAGGSTGDFSWTYPISTPPALGGMAPSVALGYSSSNVDGRTSASNNQSSWVGTGFDFWPGYVERKFKGCSDDGGSTGDLCWPGVHGNATISLNGKASELIRDDASGAWRLKNDDGSKVELLTGQSNEDNNGEAWRVTTTDGTQYYFGLNKLSGWSSGKQPTNSVWTVPVVGNNDNEQCRQSPGSFCDQGWRFNLDHVVDTNGNTMTYYYESELNRYGRDNGKVGTQYVRGGTLKRIDYGQRDGEEYTSDALAQVVFKSEERCIDGTGCSEADYPDVPLDMKCESGTCSKLTSPTFWTTKRLSKITTQIKAGAGYRAVDSWTLRHVYPEPWDHMKASMWLAGVTHTGLVGGTVSLPEMTFDGVQYANRVGTGTFAEPMVWWRMKTIRNEYGGEITVTYLEPDCSAKDVPAADRNNRRCYPTYWKPEHFPDIVLDWFNKYLVKEVTEYDRVGVSGATTVAYDYQNAPAWHYDDDNGLGNTKHKTWSQWRGYGRVQTITGRGDDGPQLKSETRYFRGMDGNRRADGGKEPHSVEDSDGVKVVDHERLQGVTRETITYSGINGPVVSRTVHDPWISPPTAREDHPWGAATAYLLDTASTRGHTALAAGGSRRIQVDKTFDPVTGLATRINDLGDLDSADDDQCTTMEYTQNTDRWLMRLPRRSEKLSVRCDTSTVKRPDDVISDTVTYYDGNDTFVAQPKRGNISQVQDLAGYKDGQPSYLTGSKIIHDKYGRAVDSWDIKGNKTHTEYTPAEGGPVTEMTVTNALGHSTKTVLEPEWGLPKSQTDANGRLTEMQYDALGRMTKSWLPGRAGKTNISANSEFSYEVQRDKPVVVKTRSLRSDGGYIETYEILDGLLRPRQKQIPAVDGGRIVTDTFYDSRGLANKANGAYFNKDAPPGGDLLEVADTAVPGQTVTSFDGAARPVAKIFRSGGKEKWRTTIGYGGDRVDSTPPKGDVATTTISNARGQTTELHQYKNGAVSGDSDKTEYRYTRRGQLSEVIDPAGNKWKYTYDLRGRMIESSDPDKGKTTLAYDEFDQLASSTDARGQTVAYVYDKLGRPTETRDGSKTGKLRTKTGYDTKPGGLGMPTFSTRYVGNEAYTTEVTGYEADTGLPTGQTVTIPASAGELGKTYTFGAKYNGDASIASTTLPAVGGLPAETLKYSYNKLSLPTTLTGNSDYVAESLYTKFAEPARYKLYAGEDSGTQSVYLNYNYQEGTRRLEQAITTRNEFPAQVSNAEYSYDDAGNITKIADTPQSRPKDVQCFQYDYLRRLTEAWTPSSADCAKAPAANALAGAAPYWHSYTYDKIGNRQTTTSHTIAGNVEKKYAYPQSGQARPHAVTSVTSPGPTGNKVDEFSYDAAGNTIGRKVAGVSQTLDWDAEGHLAKVTEGGKTTSYTYDAGGNRLLRKDPTGTTLYLPGMEVKVDANGRNASGTRYYSHNGDTVAMRKGEQVTWLAADHHDTSQIAIKQNDQSIEQRYFTPFGESRGNPAAWPDEKGFVGGTIDASTGLTHLGAREYDTANGRFISVDPVMDPLDPQQINAYAYGNNSPVTMSDPSGLWALPCADECTRDEETANNHRRRDSETRATAPAPPAPPADQIEKARQTSKRSVMDIVLEVGGDVLMEVLGLNDIKDCFTKGSAMACVSMALNFIPWGKIAKLPKIAKAMEKAYNAVQTFFTELKWAKAILKRAEEAGESAKRLAAGAAEGLAKHGDEAAAGAGAGGEAVAKHADNAATSCALHSFDPDTPVLMADGTTKPIKDVKVGDEVKATDPETGETEVRTVTQLHINYDTELTDLTVEVEGSAKTELHTTKHHPFWDATEGKWVDAAEFQVGHELRTAEGGTAVVTAVRNFAGGREMRDLTVTDIHTYYVVAGNTPVLVHNCEADDDLLDFADEALNMAPEVRPNVATKITSADGTQARFAYATDTRTGVMPPQTARAVANSGHHGGCGEVGCAIQFEEAGIPLEGSTFQSVRIGGGGRGKAYPLEDHGSLISPCPACQRFLPLIGGRG